ncbi:MAG: hypothetical protein HZB61_15420 [Nitrospirae bacterium]|nr:hypothetical protein [Nitrospirota bacterium]
MKQLAVLTLIAASLIVPCPEAFAFHEKPVTPYGDYCEQCSKYGTCKSMMSFHEAQKALDNYFVKKGFGVMINDPGPGRFIRAKIIDKGRVVDVIIFDRLTGRMRSIY